MAMRAAIRGLFARHGARDYIGEAVMQQQHMLQAAEWVRTQGHLDRLEVDDPDKK
jgi:predicted HD phosphohydrolase